MRRFLGLSFALAATAAIAPFASAHFRLLEPASWIEENNLGDPQKLGPCGGTSANQAKGKAANPGTPTNMVTKVQGGQSCTSSFRKPCIIRGITGSRWR
jgi:hypothetical protein